MRNELLRRADVGRLKALGPLLHLELDRLAFLEALVAVHLDGGEVDEDISPVRLRDEPVALLSVEPFDSTGRHGGDPPCSIYVTEETAYRATASRAFNRRPPQRGTLTGRCRHVTGRVTGGFGCPRPCPPRSTRGL